MRILNQLNSILKNETIKIIIGDNIMTREQEILIASKQHKYPLFSNYGDAFVAGARWADNHPKSPWISVEEDLPCNHEDLMENKYYTKKVLAILEWNEDPSKKHIEVCDMCNKFCSFDVEFYWREIGYYTVTHWMRLPELPKEE